jgi:hypothetical protein
MHIAYSIIALVFATLAVASSYAYASRCHRRNELAWKAFDISSEDNEELCRIIDSQDRRIQQLENGEPHDLSRFISEVEASYFRSAYDTGANLNALLIWNLVRENAGLPRLKLTDLPAYCVTCNSYHVNPHKTADSVAA